MPTEASRPRGPRHRRAPGDWCRELLWPGTVVAVTVRQALRQWQRERTSLPAAMPGPGPRGGVPAIAGWPVGGARGPRRVSSRRPAGHPSETR